MGMGHVLGLMRAATAAAFAARCWLLDSCRPLRALIQCTNCPGGVCACARLRLQGLSLQHKESYRYTKYSGPRTLRQVWETP